MSISYEDSLFRGDTLFYTGQPYKPFGFAGTETPFRIRNDGWSGLLLLVCLLLAVSLVMRFRRKFGDLLRGVFFPIPGKKDEPLVDDPLGPSTRLVCVCLLSLAAAIVTFAYTQHNVGYYPFPETPYILFGAFFLLWIVYFLAKRMMSSFVDWVFFRREKIFTMQRARTFLYAAESMLFLVFAVVVMYLPISHDKVLLSALCLVFLAKAVLLFKTFQIFFPKMYGTLYLIVYFCTLEIMPLLVMPRVLTYAECLSTIKI